MGYIIVAVFAGIIIHDLVNPKFKISGGTRFLLGFLLGALLGALGGHRRGRW